jgi:putative exosortase-associated protein (TIGR04073 family)
MMKIASILFLAFAMVQVSLADISMPKKPNVYDKLGRGIANIVAAPAEILDSTYNMTLDEGPTIGMTKGFVQGTSRMVMDVFVGAFETATFFIPTRPIKQPAYDSGQVNVYPPADLYENWY